MATPAPSTDSAEIEPALSTVLALWMKATVLKAPLLVTTPVAVLTNTPPFWKDTASLALMLDMVPELVTRPVSLRRIAEPNPVAAIVPVAWLVTVPPLSNWMAFDGEVILPELLTWLSPPLILIATLEEEITPLAWLVTPPPPVSSMARLPPVMVPEFDTAPCSDSILMAVPAGDVLIVPKLLTVVPDPPDMWTPNAVPLRVPRLPRNQLCAALIAVLPAVGTITEPVAVTEAKVVPPGGLSTSRFCSVVRVSLMTTLCAWASGATSAVAAKAVLDSSKRRKTTARSIGRMDSLPRERVWRRQSRAKASVAGANWPPSD